MVLELDKVAEGQLAKEARDRGLRPEELASEWVKSALARERALDLPPSPEVIAERREAIDQMLEESKGRTLGLKEMGLTLREFVHLGHKY